MKENESGKEFGFVNQPIGRLGFLKYAGAAIATTGLVIAGCKKKDAVVTPPPSSGPTDDQKLGSGNPVKLMSGDLGILQYAYALEQLEAAFYTTVVANASFGSIFSSAEQAVLADIKLHEVCHREFFYEALGSNATSVTLMASQVDFSSINFSSRLSVLGAAKAFEDLGVSAYNGAGRLFSTGGVAYLGLAGKIVSIEARHAAAIRDLLNPHTADFAGDDVVNGSTGLDLANDPKNVIPTANTYLVASGKIDATALPR